MQTKYRYTQKTIEMMMLDSIVNTIKKGCEKHQLNGQAAKDYAIRLLELIEGRPWPEQTAILDDAVNQPPAKAQPGTQYFEK